jgi:RNA polymerase sigma-70 factor (ECF subfamily)
LTPYKLGPEAVRQLYERHGPALLAYARSFGPDRSQAEDAVQQVFLKLLRGETETPDAPLAYLYRAVRNTALNRRRTMKRDAPLEMAEHWFSHRGGNQEAALALQSSLAELPDEQREVVIMRIWSGLTLDEISSATGTPLNTVASRYRYGLEKLRNRLKPYRSSGRTETGRTED